MCGGSVEIMQGMFLHIIIVESSGLWLLSTTELPPESGFCSAHLINEGVDVMGNCATIQWQGTGPSPYDRVTEFNCTHSFGDDAIQEFCKDYLGIYTSIVPMYVGSRQWDYIDCEMTVCTLSGSSPLVITSLPLGVHIITICPIDSEYPPYCLVQRCLRVRFRVEWLLPHTVEAFPFGNTVIGIIPEHALGSGYPDDAMSVW